MKKILLFTLLIVPFLINAQSLSYTDAAILFSADDDYGTARSMGMSNAFGALGADMTAVDINPAGLAVYNRAEFSSTMGYRNTDINSSFYGTELKNNDDFFKFTQVGGLMLFNNYGNSEFKKFAIGFNYSVVKDFSNSFFVNGNSGIPEFVDDPYLNYDDDDTNNIYYYNVDDQYFSNYMSGINDKFAFSFATQYKDLLYLGASFNTHHIDLYQQAIFEEYNNDGNNNLLDAYLSQSLSTYGFGFNFGLGAIIKPIQNLRIGLAYQSPIWYDFSERYIEDLEISVSNDPQLYTEYSDPNYFDYQLTTPGKFTGSLAYIFGKHGLVSFDYIYKNYQNIILKPTGEFINENQDLSEGLKGTSSFKLGTEWRANIFSIRGGYRFTESPYINANSSENLSGYSLGLGIKFSRSIKLDFAYDNSSYNYQYQFLNIDEMQPANLEESNYRITSTLVFSF